MEEATRSMVVLCLMGFLFTLFSNWFLFFAINVKLPFLKKRKKWKNKVDPIYKLEYKNGYYRIFKYELGYYKDDNNGWILFIPLGGIFCSYGYVRGNCYGKFNEDELKEKEIFQLIAPSKTLRDFWTTADNKVHSKQRHEQAQANLIKDKLNLVNQEFNENYE